MPAARMPIYSATKAGMHAFSMALRHQLLKLGIKVFEVVPPAVDTELNPMGRSQRGNFKLDLKPEEFVAAVMKSLKNDVFEIGYGSALLGHDDHVFHQECILKKLREVPVAKVPCPER